MGKQTLHELIEERQRLTAEAERINQKLASLRAEIAAHLNPPSQQQQQPQADAKPPSQPDQ